MNETRVIIFAMQWTSLGSCSNSFTKATSLCGHLSFELKLRNGTKKNGFVSRSANPNNTDFRKNNMANRVFLKKAESDAQQDVWTIIQKNLQWKRLLLLLVTHNPWKTPPRAKSHIMRESQHILSPFPMCCKGSIWDHRFGSNAQRFDRWCLAAWLLLFWGHSPLAIRHSRVDFEN